MLAGFLTALKIIGIVILCILAIVLLLLILILFVPIRYKIDASVPETDRNEKFDAEKISVKAKITWLLHFISAGIDFPNDKTFIVKVLGIKVFPREKKKDKEAEKKTDTNNDKIETNISYEEKSDMGELDAKDVSEKRPEETPESEKDEGAQKAEDIKDSSEENNSNCTDNLKNEPEDKSLIEIITDFFEKIENILKTPQTVLEKIQYTISRVCGKIGMIKTTLENDIFKRAFALVKKKLIKIIKAIMPKKINANILLGTGDPADTAEVMALYSALYPVLCKKVYFEPDFERKVVAADAHIKGRITTFTILVSLAICYFNKDVKKVIKRFKKIIES